MNVLPIFLLVLIFSSCTKEIPLNKKDFPDKGDIFFTGYINNKKDNAISIFGKNLLDQGISLFIDTGIGYEKYPIIYNSKTFQFDCNLSNIIFKQEKKYSFKIVAMTLNDSLIIEKTLPDSFNSEIILNYPTKQEFYSLLKIDGKINDKNIYTHDIYYSGSFGDTFSKTIPQQGNIYISRLLPYLRDLDGNQRSLDEIENINDLNLFQGIRMPYKSLYNSNCAYISILQKTDYTLTRFYKKDFEYINSLCDNVKNQGNPFFINYQIKNIQKSVQNKIYGNIVSSYILTNKSFTVNDFSDTMIKILIKNGNEDIVGNPNYKIYQDVIKNISFTQSYNEKNFIYFSENTLDYLYGDCTQNYPKFNKEGEITLQFGVRNLITNKISKTETKKFTLNQLPLTIVFQLQ